MSEESHDIARCDCIRCSSDRAAFSEQLAKALDDDELAVVTICERARCLLQELVGDVRMEVIRSSLYEFDLDILSDKQIEAIENHLATCRKSESELSSTMFRMEIAVGAAFYLGLTCDELPEIKAGEPAFALVLHGGFKLDRRTKNIVVNVVRDKSNELVDALDVLWEEARPRADSLGAEGVSVIRDALLYTLGESLYDIACFALKGVWSGGRVSRLPHQRYVEGIYRDGAGDH